MRLLLILLLIFVLSFSVYITTRTRGCGFPEGGYAYPEKIDPQDSQHFAYPLRHLLDGVAAFSYGFFAQYWSAGYNEANISLRPSAKPVFRLYFEASFQRHAVIVLREREITVKRWAKGTIQPEYDSTKLTAEERVHFFALNRYIHVRISPQDHYRKRLQDSLGKINPQILQPSYLDFLMKKAVRPSQDTMKYTTTTIQLTNPQYWELISYINKSGYWKLPFEEVCLAEIDHGHIYTLEAATPCKYNIVQRSSCPHIDSAFTKACQKFIDYAGLGTEISL